MEESEFESYLKERYYDQVDWYDRKAARNQKVYKFFQWGLIILAAITPVLVAIDEMYMVSSGVAGARS